LAVPSTGLRVNEPRGNNSYVKRSICGPRVPIVLNQSIARDRRAAMSGTGLGSSKTTTMKAAGASVD
jgi:hypothetical protein